MKRIATITVLLSVVSVATSSDQEKHLEGTYATENRSFEVDPDPLDQRKRVYLRLQGELAKEMYESMQGPVDKETCGIKGLRLKSAKSVNCFTEDSATYECVFVVNVENGSIENGFAC